MQNPRFIRACVPFVLALLSLAGASLAAAAEPAARWPGWRGPGSHGSIAEGSYARRFSPDENIAWKVELPGKGCSTPVVWEDRIVLTTPDEGEDTVLALTLEGKPLWKRAVGKAERGRHRNGSAANSSPAIDGKTVAAYFKSGNLAGLDLESGEVLWKMNLQERYGRYELYWDQGTSPVLTERHVVVAVMHGGDSYLAAFEKRSGELVWKVSRNYETPTENDHSYATPIVYEREGGGEAILVWGAERLTAHDAADGKMLWECDGFNPGGRANWVTVGSAVLHEGMAILSHGRGDRLHGVRLGGSGNVTGSHRAWNREGVGAFVPTPAVAGDRVYLVRDRGEVASIDPETGETLWEDAFPRHRASYYSSPTVAGDRLYAAREDGVVMVASVADGRFEFLAENDMDERIIASPVPVDGRLLLRGEKHLFCVERP